jgi:hypothetical protein
MQVWQRSEGEIMKKRFLQRVLLAGVLGVLTFSASAQDAKTLEKVQNLKTPSLKNKITVYYSPGYKKRAKEIQPLIEDAMRFYEQKLNLKVDLSVAVLEKAQWQQVTPIPYGLPWVSDAPHVAFLPATADGVVVSDTLKSKEFFTPAMLQKIKSSGFSFEQAAEKTVDLIGLHELGHTYSQQIGIISPRPNKWFNEFMASYFAYACLREKRPKLATLFHTMTADMAAVTPKQKHTTLDDFERLYVEVGPANYGWYQGKFFERVAQVYEAKGLSFIEEVRKAFPGDEKETLTIDVVLERSEKIAPGFISWSKDLR